MNIQANWDFVLYLKLKFVTFCPMCIKMMICDFLSCDFLSYQNCDFLSCDFLSYQNCDFLSCDFLSVYRIFFTKKSKILQMLQLAIYQLICNMYD